MNFCKLSNIPFEKDVDISLLSTMKTIGKVKYVFYPQSIKDLISCYSVFKENGVDFFIIGNGSNSLISHKTNKVGISTKNIPPKIQINDNFAYINCSCTLSKAYQVCRDNGLSGFEYLAGIPGQIGGAIKMNAGAYGVETLHLIEWVKIFKDGKIKKINKTNLSLLSHTRNLDDCLILSAKFKLERKNKCQILKEFSHLIHSRMGHQPKGFSCGCIFRNHQGQSAGQLIDKSNLKGVHVGDAYISSAHANFIINSNKASVDDIEELIKICKEEVYKNFNIHLEQEVQIIK